MEVLDLEQDLAPGLAHLRPAAAWAEAVAQPIAEQVDRELLVPE
jgi:hypothetical protein